MSGKWSKLKSKLAKFENPPEFQDKVNAAKLTLLGTDDGSSANAAFIARRYADLKREKYALDERLKGINVQLEAASQLFVDCVEADEVQKIELSDGVSVSLKDDVYVGCADQGRMYEWVRRTKQEALLTLNYQTMSGLVKHLLEAGKPAPAWASVFIKTTASARGIKGGSNGDE